MTFECPRHKACLKTCICDEERAHVYIGESSLCHIVLCAPILPSIYCRIRSAATRTAGRTIAARCVKSVREARLIGNPRDHLGEETGPLG